ncbi:MAG: type IV secretion system DNA-binding domain-containing protein [Oscillospiraceae bacterium]|nr:type IV secretion system DNA-binding domain-containing protein [Oscillospiraceae bacterium]
MKQLQQICRVLPNWMHEPILRMASMRPEEIRLRNGQPLGIVCGGVERSFAVQTVTQHELDTIIMSASERSCYATQTSLQDGYITIAGGHRIGICGTAVSREGELVGYRDISSVCIRVARDLPNVSDALPHLPRTSTLIAGKPGSGKTTMLRACVRGLSMRGERVCLADERGEVSASSHGVPQLDVGPCTDVTVGGRKSESMMRMLRAMSPQWMAADEITSEGDIAAMEQCGYCGVFLLVTAHAGSVDDLRRRPLYKRLMDAQLFDTVIFLDAQKRPTMERFG